MGGVSRAQLCMGLTLQALAPCTLLCLGCSQHFETEGIWGELRSLGYRQGSGAATGYLVIWRQPCVQPGTQMLGATPLLGMEAANGAPGPAWTRTPSIFQGAPQGIEALACSCPKLLLPWPPALPARGFGMRKASALPASSPHLAQTWIRSCRLWLMFLFRSRIFQRPGFLQLIYSAF